MYYAENTFCDVNPFDAPWETAGYPYSEGDDGKVSPWQPPYILMINRGDCTFVQKVRNAQSIGAAGVLIADNTCLCFDEEIGTCISDPGMQCEMKEAIVADDGSGGDIEIPSFLVFKQDADLVKGEVMANNPVVVEMTWDVPNEVGSEGSEVDGTEDASGYHIFAKSTKEGKSSAKTGKSSSEPFDKSGKSDDKSGKSNGWNGDGYTPEDAHESGASGYHIFAKSSKDGTGSAKTDKSGKSSKAFDKAGKSKSSKVVGVVSHEGTKTGKVGGKAGGIVHNKAGKGKTSKEGGWSGDGYHASGASDDDDANGENAPPTSQPVGLSSADSDGASDTPAPQTPISTISPTPQPTTSWTIDDGADEENNDTSPPTPKPTCNTAQDDFNLCIAIDGTGSVCSKGILNPCTGCSPGIFCQDGGFDKDTCCSNFADIKEFAKLMVNSLDEEFPKVDKSFSVVQFEASAQVESELSSSHGEQTLTALGEMEYLGGYTNHASAIEACQQTLSSSSEDRKQFILLITDGVSTWPREDPVGTAEAAATSAKEAGVNIIPVFISTAYDGDEVEDALAFMRGLSSDGKVFDVTDFASLNSLKESLVNQVSCS